MHTFDDARCGRIEMEILFFIPNLCWKNSMKDLSELLNLSQVCIEQIEVTPDLITLALCMETAEACCPVCGQSSSRVHSRYLRTLQDLSWGERALRLLVKVRRFFAATVRVPARFSPNA
jgi:transposase